MATVTHAERREELARAVKTLTTEDGWIAYLNMRARFHNYSFANTMMIMMQRPDATQVTGYGAKDGSTGWLSMGRQVRKGEKAIKIFAPMFRKDDQDEKVLYGFRIVNVFDVAQTDGDPLPAAPVVLLDGDAPTGLLERLSAVAEAEGLRIIHREAIGQENGALDRENKTVYLTIGLSNAAQCKTLAHELSHWFDPYLKDGGSYGANRAECEIVAESAAYIVCAAEGLATDPYSIGYVAIWSKGDVEVIQKAAERVDKAATLILKALEAKEVAAV